MKELLAHYFRSTPAGSSDPANKNLTYSQLALLNAEKIMGIASRFAADGNQTIENLAHLKADQIVGEWRDSTYGKHTFIEVMSCSSHNTIPTVAHRYKILLEQTRYRVLIASRFPTTLQRI